LIDYVGYKLGKFLPVNLNHEQPSCREEHLLWETCKVAAQPVVCADMQLIAYTFLFNSGVFEGAMSANDYSPKSLDFLYHCLPGQ
jgi:hypothetical protein